MGDHTATAERWWQHVKIPPGTRKKVLAIVAAVTALLVTLGLIDAETEGAVHEIAAKLLEIAGALIAAFGWG